MAKQSELPAEIFPTQLPVRIVWETALFEVAPTPHFVLGAPWGFVNGPTKIIRDWNAMLPSLELTAADALTSVCVAILARQAMYLAGDLYRDVLTSKTYTDELRAIAQAHVYSMQFWQIDNALHGIQQALHASHRPQFRANYTRCRALQAVIARHKAEQAAMQRNAPSATPD